jgi:hypothetical protein
VRVGCGQLEMVEGGGAARSVRRGLGVDGVCAGGWGDGSDGGGGPQASERGCVNGRGPLRRERTGCAREGERCRQDGPTGKRERGSGDAWARVGTDKRGPPVRGRVSTRGWAELG